jgi:hypothetical protein
MATLMLPSPHQGKVPSPQQAQNRPVPGVPIPTPQTSQNRPKISDLQLAQDRPIPRSSDPWGDEREGYSQSTEVAYAPVHPHPASKESIAIRRAEQIGSVIAGGGIIWTAYDVAHHSAEIVRFAIFPPGPLEVLGVGVLIWLVAKWCRHGV